MESEIQLYKAKLYEIAPQYLSDMTATTWAELIPLITQNVLDDASRESVNYRKLFDIEIPLISRPTKTLERILIKQQGKQKDIAYKVNSDFSAFRIHVNPDHIKSTVEKICNIVKDHNGYYHIRNPIEIDGKIQDIVQYMFVYIPTIGYVTELQIGHPFASYTFSRDSQIRDLKMEGKSIDNIVDFWYHSENTDWQSCFYIQMRNKILDPSLTINVREELFKLFGDKEEIDKDLLDILTPCM